MTFDELRAARPELGLALYAYAPGGPVTLEVHADGVTYAFRAATEAAAIELAFPLPASGVPPAGVVQPPASAPTAPQALGGTPEASVFD